MSESENALRFENGMFHHNSEATPIRHIVSAGMYEKSEPNGMLALSVLAFFAGILLAIIMMSFFPILFCWGAAIVFLFNCSTKKYGLQITTTAGKTTAFWSTDKGFVDKVVSAFHDAMNDDNKENLQQVFNIETNHVGDVFHNDNSTTNVTNIYNYDIVNSYYEGISKEDLLFLNNEFKSVMQELAQKISATDNEKLKAALEDFRQEINSPKPQSGRIGACWDKIRACSDGMDIFQNIAAAGSVVSGAIAAFM